ncbi:hypothetical protein AGMMS50212_03340 [Spirochaetia bacterium]|nr:hypothetical protein AGMMS50212_03340 [Spirochaetia bacterium]
MLNSPEAADFSMRISILVPSSIVRRERFFSRTRPVVSAKYDETRLVRKAESSLMFFNEGANEKAGKTLIKNRSGGSGKALRSNLWSVGGFPPSKKNIFLNIYKKISAFLHFDTSVIHNRPVIKV